MIYANYEQLCIGVIVQAQGFFSVEISKVAIWSFSVAVAGGLRHLPALPAVYISLKVR